MRTRQPQTVKADAILRVQRNDQPIKSVATQPMRGVAHSIPVWVQRSRSHHHRKEQRKRPPQQPLPVSPSYHRADTTTRIRAAAASTAHSKSPQTALHRRHWTRRRLFWNPVPDRRTKLLSLSRHHPKTTPPKRQEPIASAASVNACEVLKEVQPIATRRRMTPIDFERMSGHNSQRVRMSRPTSIQH